MHAPASPGPEQLRQVLGGRIADNLLSSQSGDEREQRLTLLAQVTENLRDRYGSSVRDGGSSSRRRASKDEPRSSC